MKYVLTLYIAGEDAISQNATSNFMKFLEKELGNSAEAEVINIFERPDLARKYHIVASPMLVKSAPLPIRKVIGDLSNTEGVLFGLGIEQ